MQLRERERERGSQLAAAAVSRICFGRKLCAPPPSLAEHKGNYRPSLILLLKSLRVKFSQINTLQNFSPPDRQTDKKA